MTMLPIALIRRDGDLQSRQSFDARTLQEYTEAARQGCEFVPVVVFFDGEIYWLGDGFHRVRGFQDAGFLEVPADIREGTKRDAKRYSKGANDHPQNGLRRTDADKRQIVLDCLKDDEWKEWSNVAIAEMCNVSDELVRKIRNEQLPASEVKGSNVGTSTRIGRNGVRQAAKKAPREQKAPLSLSFQSGATSNLPQNPNSDELTTPAPPPHGGEKKDLESQNVALSQSSECQTPPSSDKSDNESKPSPNLPDSFSEPIDLCRFLATYGSSVAESGELFGWLVGEAIRLSRSDDVK